MAVTVFHKCQNLQNLVLASHICEKDTKKTTQRMISNSEAMILKDVSFNVPLKAVNKTEPLQIHH